MVISISDIKHMTKLGQEIYFGNPFFVEKECFRKYCRHTIFVVKWYLIAHFFQWKSAMKIMLMQDV